MSETKLPPQPSFEEVMQIAAKHDTEKNAGLTAFARELLDFYGKACAEAARLEERERCARLCESMMDPLDDGWDSCLREVAAAIRNADQVKGE